MQGNAFLLLIAALLGYLLGSIPFGLIVTKLGGLGDVRQIGSGNIGATNVLRTGNKKLAAITLLADMAKGLLAVLLIPLLLGSPALESSLLAGIGAFLGHCFPVWLKFKGGKGVATYVGVLAGIVWPAVIVFAVCWLLTAAVFRYSSLAALIASLFACAASYWFGGIQIFAAFALLTLLTWIFHRENISRLLSGRESKIGNKS